MSQKVLVPLADGAEELEAVTIIDVLRRAGARVTVAGIGSREITGAHGIKFTADTPISDCLHETFDLIALPGGMPGAEHLRDSKELTQLLKAQTSAGRKVAAICAAPAVALAAHGLLGKKATCYPGFEGKLGDGVFSPERVVVDGSCITSKGPGTALEFALTLAALLFGQEKADEVAKGMLAR